MIQTKLLIIEYAAVINSESNSIKLEAIRKIRNLLMQIDFISETVPLESADKLKELLTSLKGESLTNEELMITEELITTQE